MKTPPHGIAGKAEAGALLPDAMGTSPAAQWADWVTIWQSELNALATDRETQQMAQQAWAQMVAFWAAQAKAAGAFLPDGARGPAGAESAPGTSSVAAPPGAGELERQQRPEFERLARRVEELERRLGELGGGD